MANSYRVQVRPTALVTEHQGQYGRATFIGLTYDGQDVYRVVFGEAPYEHAAKIRAADLSFITAVREAS